MHTQMLFSRRHFLKIAAIAGAAGTSMLIGCSLAPEQAAPAPSQPALPTSPPVAPTTAVLLAAGPFSPNAWLRIDPDETITIWVARSEMGQGVQTALPMLVAEELEADWSAIRIAQAPADAAKYGDQNTGGSTSVASSFTALRQAGAAAREMLIAAAAHAWGVDAASCHAERGAVLHPPSGRRLTYGALAGSAAALPSPRARPPPQAAGRIPDHRHARPTPGYPREGGRQRGLWPGCPRAGHALRRDRALPGIRRPGCRL